jgi:L-aspartate oxidase
LAGVVAVVGSGAAGLQAALAAARHGADVTVFTDRGLGTSNSVLAQGGMQYPVDAASEQSLIDDMVRAAGIPIDPERLQTFVAAIRPTVAELQEAGLELDRLTDGSLLRRLAGGMSEPRVVTAGDRIGAPVMRLLLRAVRGSAIDVAEHEPVRSLASQPGAAPLVLTTETREAHFDAVVIATGGRSWAEAQTTGQPTSNPKNANHLLSEALVVSLDVASVETNVFQFQPFGDVRSLDDDGVGKLIPESVASAGVRLLDARGDEIIDPLAGRLAVTDAVLDRIGRGLGVATDDGRVGVRLTLADVSVDWLGEHYPTLSRRLRTRGDLGQDQIVAPFVHYQLGGLAVGPGGRSAVPGLFLAGEITGGLHGRNRLMGNGLTDALVHGRLAGEAAGRFSGC